MEMSMVDDSRRSEGSRHRTRKRKRALVSCPLT